MENKKYGKIQFKIMHKLVDDFEKGKFTRGRFMSLMLSAIYPKKEKDYERKNSTLVVSGKRIGKK